MENENELFMIVLILEINHKIIHEGNKYSNELCTRTHPHAPTRTNIYILPYECVKVCIAKCVCRLCTEMYRACTSFGQSSYTPVEYIK